MHDGTRTKRRRRRGASLVGAVVVAAVLAGCGAGTSAPTATGARSAPPARVLLVGSYAGHAGGYATIQQAVDAARPGDWILVAPGDYHETDDASHPPTAAAAADGDFGGVVVSTPDIHLRGMSRSGVIVDGTRAGSAGPCSPDPAAQNLGTVPAGGKAEGRNGIVVFKADDVTVQNLTVCNFLA